MVNDYMLDKVLNKIKETIGIAKFDNAKILIDTDDKLPDYTTLINAAILAFIIIDDGKLYQQILLEEALLIK